MKNSFLVFLFSNTLLLIALNALNAQQPCDTIQKITFNESRIQKEFNKGFIADPLQLISGNVAGVSITRKGSDPNVLSIIYIRGISSNLNDGPLYIIDGIWNADPQYIIPDEIESIEVLKDAASTAEYGSRGMSGVIIITTKSPTGNKPFSIDFKTSLSLNNPAKRMDLLTTDEFRNFVDKNDLTFFEDGGAATDWQDEIFRTKVSQSYSLSAYGKVKSTGYRLSFNHMDYPGIALGTDRSNTGINMKISHRAFDDRLSLNASVGLRNGISNTIPVYNGMDRLNIFFQAYQRNPTDPVLEADGLNYAQSSRQFNYHNPLAIIRFTGNESTSRIANYNLNSAYKLLDGLYFNVNAGHSLSSIKNASFQKPETLYNVNLNNTSDYESDRVNLNINPGVSYGKIFSDNHRIALRAGYAYGMNDVKYSNRYTNDNIEGQYEGYYKQVFSSIILNAEYEYAERFFVSSMLNLEDYSLFSNTLEQFSLDPISRNNQYSSFTAGWKIHNESFTEGLQLLNTLILKVGFGYCGNNNFHMISHNPLRADIDDLNTERMQELSVGLDFGLLGKRISGAFVYYARNTNNAIGQRSVPVPPNAFPYVYANDFHYRNNGIELSLNAIVSQLEKFKWITSMFYFRNQNELVSGIVGNEGIKSGYINYYTDYSNNYTQLFRNGSSPHTFYLPILADISEDGRQLYYTESGSLTRFILMAKREQLGQLTPRQEMTMFNSFIFMQHFDMEFSFRYVEGHSIFNATRMALSNSQLLPFLNVTHEGVQNFNSGKGINEISDFYLENASYLRFENITLGYTLTPTVEKWQGKIRLSLSANNLFTLTKYKGLDPSYDLGGIDYFNIYPLARSFVFGMMMNF